MVDDFGGTDSDQGVYGPVGPTSGSEPAPNPNQGPAGPPGPVGPAGPRTPEAATFVVSPTPGIGDYTTIQAALDAIGPLGGGYILVREGTYDELLTYPVDVPVLIKGCGQSTVLAPTAAGNVFKIPDGLTTPRVYVIEDIELQANPAVAQTGFTLDDANGYGNFEWHRGRITGLTKLVDWIQIGDYSRQTNVHFFDNTIIPIEGGSVIATTPAPAGTYTSAAAVRLHGSSLWTLFASGDFHGWSADMDADLIMEWGHSEDPYTAAVLSGGTKVNGLYAQNADIWFLGAGDVTVNGNSWDLWDGLESNSYVFSTIADGSAAADVRLVFKALVAKVSIPASEGVCFKFEGNFVKISVGKFSDNVGFANPGIEFTGQIGTVQNTRFQKQSGAPNTDVFVSGCIKLTSSVENKISENDFDDTVTGKTVLESGTADKNIINSNTGCNNGTGLTIIGPSTMVDGAAKSDAAATTTAALVAVVATILNPKGLVGIGTVKNTGGVNSMDVKESFTDAFGTVSSVTTTLAPGAIRLLNLQAAIGTGLPSYVSYKVEVIDTVAASHTTYVSHFTSQGPIL